MSTWSPIETAPRDGTWVWAYWPNGVVEGRQSPAAWEEHSDGFRWTDPFDSRGHDQPSHWMPLPAPPDEDGEAPGQRSH